MLLTYTYKKQAACRSIHNFAENFKKTGLPLNCLVNCAGVFLVPHDHTKEGFEVGPPQILDELAWRLSAVYMQLSCTEATSQSWQPWLAAVSGSAMGLCTGCGH